MAIIVIKDLPDSVELDRQAMLAIAGGSHRSRGPSQLLGRAKVHSGLLKYPASFLPVSRPLPQDDRQALHSGRKRAFLLQR